MSEVREKVKLFCYHCGEDCNDSPVSSQEKNFCCEGCRAVYEILEGHNLCSYYEIDGEAGLKIREIPLAQRFDYLDDKDVISKLIEFTNKNISTVSFSVPNIHCSSCVWLLERMNKINDAILSSRVDFLQKRVSVVFDNEKTSLKAVVKSLVSVGYEPSINLDSDSSLKPAKKSYKDLYARIGVAGFCLGNIMLLSFPEYLNIGDSYDENLKNVFNYLNILLGIPVITYCSSVYFSSAWKGIKSRFINIDLPISIGLLALFFRSVYDIAVHGNAGFMDSLAGLVFFLLIGKLFQNKTYDSLNFDRDYRSYFPISVTIVDKGKERCIPVSKLKAGDRIVIRNNEIVPVDAILFRGEACVDYSFVTGESMPEQKVLGEIVYAGGRHLGSAIELEVMRSVSQSYLTQLWNDKAFDKSRVSALKNLTDNVGKYFTFVILIIAFGSAAYWIPVDADKALTVFTTVLIIACPCALALTTPFALGNSLRILGKNGLYLRNAGVIESMAGVDSIVFDKTGTITNPKNLEVEFIGSELTGEEESLVKSLVRNSTHPLSRKISESLNGVAAVVPDAFEEIAGEGMVGNICGKVVRMGSIRFVLEDKDCPAKKSGIDYRSKSISTNVFVSIDCEVRGFFSFKTRFRNGLEKVLNDFAEGYEITMLSGDRNHDSQTLTKLFKSSMAKFEQLPSDKLNYVRGLQVKGRKVLMLGDGLNDAGALRQSDVGIAVSEDISSFSPSCDAILDAERFGSLSEFVRYSKSTMKVIKVSFAISFMYNAIGLALASQGYFSPMIAAILMPFNSISIVLFVIAMTNLSAKRRKLL